MKAATVVLAAAAMLAASAVSTRADAPLAGRALVALSPGQAFCSSPRELAAYTLAKIQHDGFPFGAFPGCVTVTQGTPVQVLEDLGPRGYKFHVVRARAAFSFPFRAIEAYTYSVGLYRPYTNSTVEFRPFP